MINENYLKLAESYLFSDIKKKVNAYKEQNPEARIISLGIGDVTRPIVPAIIEALHKAVDEMGCAETFRGYGPEQGYRFLQERIIEHDFRTRGVELDPDEIFVGDGAKSDLGNIGDILSVKNRVAVTDPVYPVYVDTNVMAGRAGELAGDGGALEPNRVYSLYGREQLRAGSAHRTPRHYLSVLPQQPHGNRIVEN